jgi:hypothetical protein
MKRFQPPVEPWKTDVTGIADLHPLLEMFCDEYDAADKSDDLSNLGSAEGKPPISLKQTEFSLKQFGKRMGQDNYSAFNKWNKVWVAGSLEKKHWSIIRGQNCLRQAQDRPLHWEMAVADLFTTFENWLPLGNFDNAEWIGQQWDEMLFRICECKIEKTTKMGR